MRIELIAVDDAFALVIRPYGRRAEEALEAHRDFVQPIDLLGRSEQRRGFHAVNPVKLRKLSTS